MLSLGSVLSVRSRQCGHDVFSTLGFVQMSSSISLRSSVGNGGQLSLFGVRNQLAVGQSLSVIDTLSLGSTLSLRAKV